MHRLAPNDPHALGYLAHANRMHGTKVEVRPWLQRALQLKPDYAWAAGELFDLELGAGNLDAARSALEMLKTHSPSPGTQGREVELLARRRDKHVAMRRYRELLRVTGDERDAIRLAAKALVAAGWRRDLLEVLDTAVRDPATHPAAGTLWVNVSLEVLGSRFMPPRAALENGALGRAAAEAYLDDLAKTRSQPRLRRFLRKMRGWLAADTATWGMVGYALLEAGLTRRARRWLADWRTRADAKPWMLLNAACALRDHGEDADAAVVSHHALTLSPDHAHACHELWLAADAALAGRPEEAAQRIARAQAQESDSYYECLTLLARAVMLLGDPAGGADADALPGSASRWCGARWSCKRTLLATRRCAACSAARCGAPPSCARGGRRSRHCCLSGCGSAVPSPPVPCPSGKGQRERAASRFTLTPALSHQGRGVTARWRAPEFPLPSRERARVRGFGALARRKDKPPQIFNIVTR